MTTRYWPLSEEDESRRTSGSPSIASSASDVELERKGWPAVLQTKTQKSLIATISLLIIFATVIITFQTSTLVERDKRQPVPRLAIENVVFQNETAFNGPSTPETEALWMDLMGPGMGFVAIENPSQYGLSAGTPNPKKPPGFQNYGISMYHQLHCLALIHENFWAVLRKERTLEMFEGELLSEQSHLNHCFDYIRQGVMCAGDMTIESAIPKAEGGKNQVDGMGMMHQCKSWQESRDWMDANRP